LANKDLLAGKGTVTLDVTGHGATLTALKQSLAGSAALNLRDGAIKGINLAQSVRQAKALLGKQDATQVSQSGQQTDFSELAASFRIRDGVAHNDDLSMKSPYLRLGGAGDVDIGRNRIDYLAKATVVNTEAGQGGQGLDELRGLTIPVRLSGPLEKISWKIELGEVLRDAATAKAKAKLNETLKDKLKGLFGK
jgi:AsmA protein